jgi:hypothetical protein
MNITQLARAGLAAAFIAANSASASSILVTIDTTALSGTQTDLAFDLVNGGAPANTVTVSNFTTDGVLGASSTKGSVTDAFPASVILSDGSFFSEYLQTETLGKSLSFVLNTTGLAPTGASLPDGFSFFLLDHRTGLPLVTTSHPTGANALLVLNIGMETLPDLFTSDKVKVSAAIRLDSGAASFCDATSYDNATVQTRGLFTDLRRGTGIGADYANCLLIFTGSAGASGDMWITMLNSPDDPPPPTFSCVSIDATVTIHKFDNRKAVGFVANYDPATQKGLFLGLYDAGNSDGLTLSTFSGATGQLLATVKTLFLGAKVLENVGYFLELDICNDGTTLTATGTVKNGTATVGVLSFTGPIPAGISPSGQIGVGGQAKSAAVDSSVARFEWGPVKQ